MQRHREKAGDLTSAVDHFIKVTRSYWPGLFHTYDEPDLPRTNNALEQAFGSHRYHERRTSGRRSGSRSLVIRGPARLPSAVLTRLQPPRVRDLAQPPAAHRRFRDQLQARASMRRRQSHFRKDPAAYLQQLEDRVAQMILPN